MSRWHLYLTLLLAAGAGAGAGASQTSQTALDAGCREASPGLLRPKLTWELNQKRCVCSYAAVCEDPERGMSTPLVGVREQCAGTVTRRGRGRLHMLHSYSPDHCPNCQCVAAAAGGLQRPHRHRHRVTFIHIGKAGGKSVVDSLLGSNVMVNHARETKQPQGCSPENEVCQVHYRQATPSDMAHGVKVHVHSRPRPCQSIHLCVQLAQPA